MSESELSPIVVYICDGKACDDKTWAPVSCKTISDEVLKCLHTTNPAHAKYGICKDPENHPERFEQLEDGEFWEIEKNMSHG